MMAWAYRVVRTTYAVQGEPVSEFAIHEAYTLIGRDQPSQITAAPQTTSFDSIDALRDALTRMLASLDQPVLRYEDF